MADQAPNDAGPGSPPGSATVDCAGVPIRACTPAEAAATVVAIASRPNVTGADVHLCNAYTVALADREPDFRDLLRAAALNFPDGKSVVWANRRRYPHLGLPTERVYGPDLMLDVVRLGRDRRLRHYLLGSTPEVLADLADALRRIAPGVVLAGCESPPFRDLTPAERAEQAARITASGAQVVWVGLGTPKQDWECARLAGEVPAVCVAVGAAFDFIAGHKAQAPRWMQRHGLEWVHRLASEPRRLWRRYLFGNARFLWAVSRGPMTPPQNGGPE